MITTQQLQLLKEGNKNAFEALYRGYNARIYNFVLSMVSNAGWRKISHKIFFSISGRSGLISIWKGILTAIFLKYPKTWYIIM